MADTAPLSSQLGDQTPQQSRPSTLRLVKLGLSYVPLITRVSFSHTFNFAQTSQYNDLRSALIVAALRAYLTPPGHGRRVDLSRVQKRTIPKLPVKGRMWISQYTCPVPPESAASIRTAVGRAIESLRNTDLPVPVVIVPDVVPVSGEWTGYRAGAKAGEPQPNMSARDKYAEMMKEVKSPTTILYFHGGGHAFMDPSTHRSTVKKLAKITGGRALSVRYRLAPQNPFPASLVDCLVAYLALLYPPPGSYHEPVSREHIVIAGDSAGGNLTMGLIQMIVDLNRMGQRIEWHGQAREVPVPAAAACNSAWLDVTHSSGPYYGKIPHVFDYLNDPGDMGRHGQKPCAIWPASPPRKYVYAADDMTAHPYVTSLMRRDWTGFPPVYLCAGWERLAYEAKFLAQKLKQDGVTVVFEEYEAMPHCFALFLTQLGEARRCMDNWAGFIGRAARDPASLRLRSTIIHAKTLEETPCDFSDLCDVSAEVVRRRVVDTIAKTKAWTPLEAKL